MIDQNKPDFNMAVLFLTRLDKRLDERDTASINGNILAWYRSLRSIYRNIHFKVKEKGHEEKEKELNELFEKAKNLLSIDSISNRSVNNQVQALSISKTEELLDKIDLLLNDLMYEYHLIFPKKKENNPNRAVEDMF